MTHEQHTQEELHGYTEEQLLELVRETVWQLNELGDRLEIFAKKRGETPREAFQERPRVKDKESDN